MSPPRLPSTLRTIFEIGDIQSVIVKPFEVFPDSPWKDLTWELRLLNGLEWIEAHESAARYTAVSGQKSSVAFNIASLARSLIHINGKPLMSQEDLKEFNRVNELPEDTPVDTIKFIEFWVRNIELPVLNRFEEIYLMMMQKQRRMLEGVSQCKECGGVFTNSMLPVGSTPLQKSLAEIVCGGCHLEKTNGPTPSTEETPSSSTDSETTSGGSASESDVRVAPDPSGKS